MQQHQHAPTQQEKQQAHPPHKSHTLVTKTTKCSYPQRDTTSAAVAGDINSRPGCGTRLCFGNKPCTTPLQAEYGGHSSCTRRTAAAADQHTTVRSSGYLQGVNPPGWMHGMVRMLCWVFVRCGYMVHAGGRITSSCKPPVTATWGCFVKTCTYVACALVCVGR